MKTVAFLLLALAAHSEFVTGINNERMSLQGQALTLATAGVQVMCRHACNAIADDKTFMQFTTSQLRGR